MSIVVSHLPTVQERILTLTGLDISVFENALRSGHLAFVTCPAIAPPMAPGTHGWEHALVTFRSQAISHGWRIDDPGNFSLTINDQLKINIAVQSGDDGTGLKHLTPSTKSYKGMRSQGIVLSNNQLDLFPSSLPVSIQKRDETAKYPTWILLTYFMQNQIRAELSYPIKFEHCPDNSHKGKIKEWGERIILPTIDFDTAIEDTPPAQSGPTFDFSINRKP